VLAARPNQKRLVYSFELSTPLFWRVEIHSRMTRNFAPSQHPTNPETITPRHAYAHLQLDLTTAERADATSRTARTPWNIREFKTRARTIPELGPYLVIRAEVPGSTGRYDTTAAETARYCDAVRNAFDKDART